MAQRLKLYAKADFVTRLSQAPICAALEELIWNAFDENATAVQVDVTPNKLEGVERIEIRDNGTSLSYRDAPIAFTNLGSSEKPTRKLKTGDRLHGRKGEGRLKAFSLGAAVRWRFVYGGTKGRFAYEVEGTRNREDPFYLTDEARVSDDVPIGCTVTVTEIIRSLHQMLRFEMRRDLAAVFAPFLLRHPDKQLVYFGRAIRPKDAIESRARIRSIQVSHEEEAHKVTFEVIHWNESQKRREVMLCSQGGIPLHRMTSRTGSAQGNYSVFVSSSLFDVLHEQNLLATAESTADSGRREIVKRIWQKVQGYFRDKNRQEVEAELQKLRDEGSYPYQTEPKSEIDKVERKVFDLCTVKISQHLPNFNEGMDTDGRKLLLRVVREAVNQNPGAVGKIIKEVCKLPPKEAESFAKLLEDVPLSNIIQLSGLVADRLKFLALFESVVYLNPFESVIKERTQLQKLLVPNTWLFGEEYSLGTDDENLKKVLEQHVHILGRDHLNPEVRDADIQKWLTSFNKTKEKTPESLGRIPDLMLWRQFQERRPDEYEFLVIELKRPGVTIGRKEMAQIEDYANSVVSTPFRDKERSRWVFVVVSDDLDQHAHARAHQPGRPPFEILASEQHRYVIQARPWSQFIQSARARHNHLQDWLGYQASQDKVLNEAVRDKKLKLPKRRKLARP